MASEEYLELLQDIRARSQVLLWDLIEEAAKLHTTKNAGYAGADNPDPWANFRRAERIGLTPLQGCMTRWGDKVIRVENLLKNPDNEQVGESLRDTLMDLSAYSLIAICLMEEEKRHGQASDDTG